LKKDRIISGSLAAIFIVCAVLFAVRIFQTQKSRDVMELAQNAVVYPEKDETPSEKEEPAELEKPPIEVDFDYLLKINPEVKGWLYCDDSAINFELMQSSNNDYYLNHLLDRSENPYGTVFLDCRCAGDFSDANTVVFGHDMQNGSMFGGLELYRDQDYYEKHSVLYLLTPEKNWRLEAVSGFIHTEYLSMYNLPSSDEDVAEFLGEVLANSTFKPLYEVQEGDRFVTLSCCADDFSGARYALMCRMVEIGK